MPVEFPRKCRTFGDLDRWKASELRQFLLYVGPVALKNILDDKLYENFINFSVCVFILSCSRFCLPYQKFVHSLIMKSLKQYAALYGESELTYNFHGLSHIVEDVIRLGPLEGYLAFPFESYMQHI